MKSANRINVNSTVTIKTPTPSHGYSANQNQPWVVPPIKTVQQTSTIVLGVLQQYHISHCPCSQLICAWQLVGHGTRYIESWKCGSCWALFSFGSFEAITKKKAQKKKLLQRVQKRRYHKKGKKKSTITKSYQKKLSQKRYKKEYITKKVHKTKETELVTQTTKNTPEAVTGHGSQRNNDRHGRDSGAPGLRKGGNPPGDSKDTSPDNVLDEVENRPADGYTAAAGLIDYLNF